MDKTPEIHVVRVPGFNDRVDSGCLDIVGHGRPQRFFVEKESRDFSSGAIAAQKAPAFRRQRSNRPPYFFEDGLIKNKFGKSKSFVLVHKSKALARFPKVLDCFSPLGCNRFGVRKAANGCIPANINAIRGVKEMGRCQRLEPAQNINSELVIRVLFETEFVIASAILSSVLRI